MSKVRHHEQKNVDVRACFDVNEFWILFFFRFKVLEIF